MSRKIKIAVISVVGLISTTAAATQITQVQRTGFIEKVCQSAPLLCQFSTLGNGDGKKPDLPTDPPPPVQK